MNTGLKCDEFYSYTYQYKFIGRVLEEIKGIPRDMFYPYGEVKEGTVMQYNGLRFKIIKVFHNTSSRYGKFIAESLSDEEFMRLSKEKCKNIT